ncbi:MAG: hypothetical protein AB8G96_10185, partial [Phycisphaerales bacterium]
GAVSQELNLAYLVEPTTKMGNRWLDDSMTDVAVVSCQNFADLSMFQRGSRWVDSRLIARSLASEGADAQQAVFEPARTIEFGTEAWEAIVDELVRQRRQGLLAIRGDVLLDLDGDCVLIRNPA